MNVIPVARQLEVSLPARPPINYTPKKQSWARKYLVGSAFAAALWEFLIFFALNILWFVLFDLAIEEAYPSVFPVSATFGVVLFLVISLVSVFYFSLEHTLYNSLVTEIQSVFGNTNTLAMEIASAVDASRYTSGMVSLYWSFEGGEIRRYTETPLRVVLRDLDIICAAMVLAQRFEHRSVKDLKKLKQTIDPNDMSDVGSALDISALPLTPSLKHELRYYAPDATSTSGLADQMWDMVYKRLSRLYHNQHIPNTMFQSMDRQMSGLSTSTAIIIANKAVGALPIVTFFLRISTYLWCFSIPWQLWGEYRWFGLLASLVMMWFILALWRIGHKLADPFDSYNKSAFIWNDLTKTAVGTAHEIHRVFQQLERIGLGRTEEGEDFGLVVQ